MCKINALIDGNETVFKEIFDDFHEVLYLYVIKKTGSYYIAEEVVQITFIKLWKYRKRLNLTLSLSTQLFRIAKTVLIDLLRKEQTMKKYSDHIAVQEPICNQVCQQIEFTETKHKIDRLIQLMPPLRREVFTLSRFACLSYKEIANQLSISPKTVENHIYLALKQLKPYFVLMVFFVSIF